MSSTLATALWRYRGFIMGSVRREFQARYRNSLLGGAWADAFSRRRLILAEVLPHP